MAKSAWKGLPVFPEPEVFVTTYRIAEDPEKHDKPLIKVTFKQDGMDFSLAGPALARRMGRPVVKVKWRDRSPSLFEELSP
ncbi:MAG: hypothetical protein VYE40_16130 [Myxococcota bacterium]|nr:hypothetical protein [Myxococcota bacterium]MEC9442623.1 hypothetical protein [Myxococcota bacterium]